MPGKRFQPLVTELSSKDGINRCCEQFDKDYGPVHVLINNAGIITTGKFLETSLVDLGAQRRNIPNAYL